MSGVAKLGPGAPPPTAPARLDAAARALLAQPVDPATRVQLERFQSALAAHGVAAGPEGLDPPTLTGAVLDYIMPRVSDPSVLRLDRRVALIRQVLADPEAARGGTFALRHELRGLELLRRNRDSLVGG